MTRTLSQKSLDVIASFSEMPYYNNKRQNVRFGLRARVGKGTAEEILDEAQVYAMQEKIDWQSLSPEMRKKFLIDHKLGIDCSAFAYYVLEAESQAQGLGPLSKHLSFPFNNSLFSRLGRILRNRYVENADVRTFAHENNSHEVKPRGVGDIQPGDFIVRMNEDDPNSRNHIMVVTSVGEVGPHQEITIAHSEAKQSDGKYGHGTRIETLELSSLILHVHRLNWF